LFINASANRTLLLSSILICIFQSWSSGQTSPQSSEEPTATFQSNSELVLVPVVVTDSKGNRVTDLSADDFTILEESKPHIINSFDRIHGQPMPPRQRVGSDVYVNVSQPGALPPPVTIILLDSINTSALDQKNAIEQIAKMLSLPFPGPVALWQLGPKGIVVVQDFTTDQRELAAASQRLRTARSAEDLLNTTTVAGHRPYFFVSGERDYSGTINTYADVDKEQKFNQLALEDVDRRTLDTMHQVAKGLRQVEGRKSLFWATGGLSSTVEDEIGKELAAANVSVYPIEISPNKGPRASPVYFNNRVRYREHVANGLRAVAEETGGVYCAYAAQASDCLATGLADSSDYYMLTFSIDSRHVSPGPHPIEVRVRRADAQVRARSAYFVQGSTKSKGRWAEIASAMDSPLDYTSLPFAIRWTGKNEANGKIELSFRYIVPRGTLEVKGQKDTDLDLSFAATALGKDGKPAGTFSKNFSGKLSPETAAELAEKGLFWDGSILVDPSANVVRFVVRDNLTGRIGSLSVPR
jgi:VWFA-related protein